MENTQYINLDEYVAVVEGYIYYRTGKRIKIVFDDPMRFRLHFRALVAYYDYATAYYKKEQNR